ncbi:MAG: glutamine-hydrolyzing carbamoyl-phosphate synthase small subunit [Acutalibacteraceae bacterium]
MIKNADRKIILENGSEYYGTGFGSTEDKVTELVFNTSMVGYQEILSDPSYTAQGIVMTYPLIGNYGMADDDYETKTPTADAMIVREYNDEPSNFRSRETLGEVMLRYGISGVSGIDTRKLTREIRTYGTCKALITNAKFPLSEGLEIIKNTELSHTSVSRVSRKQAEYYETDNPKYNIVAVDCGMKQNIVRSLNKKGCNVIAVPWNTGAEEIRSLSPDGVFLSNGPGDPTDVPEVIDTVKKLKGQFPIFGICLGHQILSLAYGAKTYKLKFGHRGGNHPIKCIETDKLEITSQNHSYAVDAESLKDTPLTVTHINLLDNTIEGVECKKDKAFAVQYHPESAPGPQDSEYLFDKFLGLMEENKNA